MLFTVFKYLFSFQRYYANWPSNDITHPNFDQHNLVLSTGLIFLMCIGHHKEIWVLMFRTLALLRISLRLWPCLTFFELKISNTLESSGWRLEKSGLPWEQNNLFDSHGHASHWTISLPNFNVLRYKLTKIALFIYLL